MRNQKTLSIIALVAVMALSNPFTGCRSAPSPAWDIGTVLAAAPDAGAAMQELFRSKKILFLSEEHSIVNPILFLTENLSAFHAAGLRYLFLEGGLPQLPDSPGFGFPCFYPWTQAGWKYEEVRLAQALGDLNASLPEGDRIRVVFAEAGNDDNYPYDPTKVAERLNERDRYAQGTIIRTMETSRPGDKALVFYGGAHGATSTQKDFEAGNGAPPFDWKPLGAYLKEKYGDRFSSIDFRYLAFSLPEARAVVPAGSRRLVALKGAAASAPWLSARPYDAAIFEAAPVYGIGYQFVPSDRNLRFIFSTLRNLATNPKALAADRGGYRFGPLGSYAIDIYYLKLYYQDHFDYRLWNPDKPLAVALDGLAAYAFAPGISPSEKIIVRPPDDAALRKYMESMRSTLGPYVERPAERVRLQPSLPVEMETAARFFPEDLWPDYWRAYALTRAGDYSGALALWRSFLAEPLAPCMESYPRALSMAADCAAEAGTAELAEEYAKQAREAVAEGGLDFSGFVDVL